MRNVLNKYSVRTPVKRRKTAVYSRNRTVASQDFMSTAFLRYGAYPYSTVFCTAVAVYGTVVSPSFGGYGYGVGKSYPRYTRTEPYLQWSNSEHAMLNMTSGLNGYTGPSLNDTRTSFERWGPIVTRYIKDAVSSPTCL